MISRQPRKQRKFLYNAPLHLRKKQISAHLSKELRKIYKRRSLPLREGDEVKIMRGENAGKTGKISKTDLEKYKVYIEGVVQKKTVGPEVQVPIHPSNLLLTNPIIEDEMRAKILRRKVREVKVEKRAEQKPKEEKMKVETKMEEKHGETEKTSSAKVLESGEKRKKVDSRSKTRSAQKV